MAAKGISIMLGVEAYKTFYGRHTHPPLLTMLDKQYSYLFAVAIAAGKTLRLPILGMIASGPSYRTTRGHVAPAKANTPPPTYFRGR